MVLTSVQKFPVSVPKPPDEPAAGPDGTVTAPLGKLTGGLPELLEPPQPASSTHPLASTLMTRAARLCGMSPPHP